MTSTRRSFLAGLTALIAAPVAALRAAVSFEQELAKADSIPFDYCAYEGEFIRLVEWQKEFDALSAKALAGDPEAVAKLGETVHEFMESL